jgi:electron transfer flavoprotein beta subunit
MKILVCISNVPDTTTKIKLTADSKNVDLAGVQWIINPWDELALTRAVELRETQSSVIQSVIVATVGAAETEATLRKALAIGADKAYRVDIKAEDSWLVANQLAEVVKKENPDVIFTGVESSDYNGSAVGGMLAELLDMNSVSSVTSFQIESGQVIINREMDGGQEQIAPALPFLAVVQKGIAIEPRIPAMRGIMMARQKPLEVIPPVEVQALVSAENYELPKPKSTCKMIEPEKAVELMHLLHSEAKVI